MQGEAHNTTSHQNGVGGYCKEVKVFLRKDGIVEGENTCTGIRFWRAKRVKQIKKLPRVHIVKEGSVRPQPSVDKKITHTKEKKKHRK
jgi:hypothetical protein